MPCFPIGRITDFHPTSVFPIVSFAVVQNRRQVLQVVFPSFSPLIVERHLIRQLAAHVNLFLA